MDFLQQLIKPCETSGCHSGVDEFKSSGTLCRVDWYALTNVLEVLADSIFNDQIVLRRLRP
jgi:hypothetical protein